MNWQTQLKNAVRTDAPAAPVVADVSGIAAQLREAAKLYAPRRDNFAQGKESTCLSMAESLERYGSFASDRQRDFALKLIEWSKPKPPTPEQQNQQAAGVFPVPQLFTVMQKHSTFYVGDTRISRRNQDTLCWVTFKGVCVGKLENATCTLFGKRTYAAGTTVETLRELIRELEANPLEAAKKYGKLSGRCCSCGRDLTDPASIEAGIGPICAGKFS